MKYQGGKTRHGKQIAAIISEGLAGGTGNYVEPFMGACGVARHVAPHAVAMMLSDASEDLVLLWQAVMDGWEPPTELSEDAYNILKTCPPSALRAFAGYGCSFGGKWFDGYARTKATVHHDGRITYRAGGQDLDTAPNYAASSASALTEKRLDLARCPRVTINHTDYRTTTPRLGDVVYCDPPYAGTRRYPRMGTFDSDEFWSTMQAWDDAHAFVFVSEFTAPDGWVPVWGKPRNKAMHGGAHTETKTDQLFCTPTVAQLLGLADVRAAATGDQQ